MLDFPGPGGLTVGQIFSSAGQSWRWDGIKWAAAAGAGAPLDSPSFTGDPKAPTPATADNDTSIATTAFVKAQGYLLNNQSITLSGDVSGSGTTAITTTLATVPVAKGGTGATTAPTALTNLGAVAKAGDTMTGALTVTTNATVPATDANGLLHLVAPNGVPANLAFDTFAGGLGGTNYSTIQLRQAGGTAAAPTASVASDIFGIIQFKGYANGAYQIGSQIYGTSSENWTATARGSAIKFSTITGGTTTNAERVVIAQGLIVGGATDPGHGSINAFGSINFGGTLTGAAAAFSSTIQADGYKTHAGTGGGFDGHVFNISWATSAPVLWIDNVNVGQLSIVCDYRIKENVTDLPSTWDKVRALRPISYTIADNAELLSRASDAEQWGFIAHELQETLIESAATGFKDAPNLVQSPNIMTLVSSLTKALQEAMARIETLEAAR
jgi:hypothetical protein